MIKQGYKKVFDTSKLDFHYCNKKMKGRVQIQDIKDIGLLVYYDNEKYIEYVTSDSKLVKRFRDDVEALRGGVRLIAQKFNEVMRQQGVNEIEAVGKEFDVDLHEAVARFPIEGKSSGEIIDVVQKGYKLGEKVVRYAKVVVAE